MPKIFYQGLALEKLRKEEGVKVIFEQLVVYGNPHQNNGMTIDYLAVVLPDLGSNLNKRSK